LRKPDYHFAKDALGAQLSGESRRDFLARAVTLPAALALAGRSAAGHTFQDPIISSTHSPNSRAFDFSTLSRWITSNEEFFIRSHFGVPAVDQSAWAVTIDGEVRERRTLTMVDITKLPATEMVVTLECAGNLVGWGGVSNARWEGVRLKTLLEAAGVKSGAVEVVLAGADGGAEREAGGIRIDAYARSIPVAKAMDGDTLLAYRMNGEPLPAPHGGPLRAVVPGWYGMDSVKWLKRISVVGEPFKGFYQSERYYEARRGASGVERGPLGPMRVKSQIARPLRRVPLKVEPTTIFGAAWSGAAEVERVLLSFDGGRSWREARLGAERAPYAWRLWSYEWTPPALGHYEIIARARDLGGREQPFVRDPLILTPYANNWVDRRSIDVRP
jgi:DMSO/TMAO reductase YedYZ molybdopterin-dependent catalytic subunit